MANLDASADRAVHNAVDAFMEGRLVPDFAGETVFETKHSRYRLRDGVVYAAPSDGLVGAELVGWLIDAGPRSVVESAWQPGSRAVLVDRARGRNIIVTSSTRLLHLESGSQPPPALGTPIPLPSLFPSALPRLDPPRAPAAPPPTRAANFPGQAGGPRPFPGAPTPRPVPAHAFPSRGGLPLPSPLPPSDPYRRPFPVIPHSPVPVPPPGARRAPVHPPPRPIGRSSPGLPPMPPPPPPQPRVPTPSLPPPGYALPGSDRFSDQFPVHAGHEQTRQARQERQGPSFDPNNAPPSEVSWEVRSSEYELDESDTPGAEGGEENAASPIPLVKPRDRR